MTTAIAAPTQAFLDGAQDISQPARYKFIADLLWDAGSVIDVGCGDGILREYINCDGYMGIDADPVAIEKAQVKYPARQFMCANAETCANDWKVDAVILNEFLYYTSDPLETLRKWGACVKDGGLLVVSIYNRKAPFWQKNPNKQALKIARQFASQFQHKEHVLNENGKKRSVLVIHC